jgi:hypothetical protein
MKIFALLAGVAGAMAIASAATATTYDFSYIGQDGDTFSGSFSGTQSGDVVAITAVNDVKFNGTEFSGGLNVDSYVGGPGSCYGAGCYVAGGASVNLTNPLADNFLFINNTNSNYFYVIPWSNGGNNTTAVQGFFGGVPYDNYNGEFVASNFKVSSVSAAPEPSTWALMIGGLAMVGGMLRTASARRRQDDVAGIATA